MMNLINKPSFLFTVALVTGCSSSYPVAEQQQRTQSVTAEQFAAHGSLNQIFNQWNGVPYRWGGNSKSGIDCSAFTQVVMQEFDNTVLPRTTSEQSKTGYKIGYQQAQVGDLVFFKVSRKQKHVGVYLGESKFMHASTSKGVIISRLDNPYWADAFWHFRRVN